MILIIGSRGFIGSHLVAYFEAKYEIVLEADVEVNYNSKNYFCISDVHKDYDQIFKTYDGIELCINASGAASVPRSFSDCHTDFLLNSVNVHYILESIRVHNPSCKFINLSSAAVYGEPINLPIKESHELCPISPYGYHKRIAEELCQEYSSLYSLKTCSIRIFSAYGEGLKKQLFWDIYSKSLRSKKLELFGTGKESRDFIHVEDVCLAIDVLQEKGEFTGERYNVASGIQSSIENVVKIFFGLLKWDGVFDFQQSVRTGDPKNWVADISKISKLGFKPKIDIREGLDNYVKWLREIG